MTPEHLPTEQYEAQLAEKVVRLQSMMAPFSDLAGRFRFLSYRPPGLEGAFRV